MTTAARVAEIRSALRAAGDRWEACARELPEFGKLYRGRPGAHREVVELNTTHPEHDLPIRLIRHESGVWFELGMTVTAIDKEIHDAQA